MTSNGQLWQNGGLRKSIRSHSKTQVEDRKVSPTGLSDAFHNLPSTSIPWLRSSNQRQSEIEIGVRKVTLQSEAMSNVLNHLPSMPPRPKVSDLFTKTDIHGLPELYESRHHKLKAACWLIILVGAFGFMSYELVKVFLDWRENPVFTMYKLVLDKHSLPFPDVYLCPGNPIHRATWLRANVHPEWEAVSVLHAHAAGNSTQFVHHLTTLESLSNIFGSADDRSAKLHDGHNNEDEEKPSRWVPDDAQHYFMEVGYPLETFIIGCLFGGLSLNCSYIVEPIFDNDYGKCFLVRPGHDQVIPGVGLKLALHLDIGNAYPEGGEPLYDGVVMKISHKFDIASQEKILMYPGTHTDVALQLTKLQLIKRKRISAEPQCIDEEDGRAHFHVLNSSYSQASCRFDCILQQLRAECGCIWYVDRRFLRSDMNHSFCGVHQRNVCAGTVALHSRNNSQEQIRACAAKCISPCEIWNYQKDMSISRLHTVRRNKPVVDESFTNRGHPCLQPLEAGYCHPQLQFAYDAHLDECVMFTFLSCGGNKNRFHTQAECVEACSADPQNPPCQEALDPGWRCEPSLRFYFDNEKAECIHFDYFGCQSNGNNFVTAEECGRTCSAVPLSAKTRAVAAEATTQKPERKTDEYVHLDVAFSTLQYVEISEENSMTFDTFVSNVGGQVGLWIGASIVTMVKFFVVLFPLLFGRREARVLPQ